jgi:hypothetical protein
MRSTLRLALVLAAVLAPAAGAKADTHDVSFDAGVDFGALKTFAIRGGHVASEKPEIDNRLFRQRMEYSIRESLVQKGLDESDDLPDVTVTFNYTEKDISGVERNGPTRIPDSPGARGFVIPGSGPSPVMFIEGTLVIDLLDASGKLLWRGTWRDEEQSGPKL